MKYVLQLIQAFRLLFNVLGSNPPFLETSVIVCPFKSFTKPTEDEACSTTKKMPKCPICDPQSTTSNDDRTIIVDDYEIIDGDCC